MWKFLFIAVLVMIYGFTHDMNWLGGAGLAAFIGIAAWAWGFSDADGDDDTDWFGLCSDSDSVDTD